MRSNRHNNILYFILRNPTNTVTSHLEFISNRLTDFCETSGRQDSFKQQ